MVTTDVSLLSAIKEAYVSKEFPGTNLPNENPATEGAVAAVAGPDPTFVPVHHCRRRDVLRFVGAAAAASALPACGGTETMEMPMSTGACVGPGVGEVATGAETLQVNQVMNFNRTPRYYSFFVCRDDKGFFAINDSCTHSGCNMMFNSTAKTFDCPCHGSRYRFDGTVLNGPTTMNLFAHPMCRRDDGKLIVDNMTTMTDTSGRVK